jgi:glycosyltransferase involved in cell wall biosynthesis
MYTKIVFWEPTVSPHKTQFLSEIANISPGVDIICIAHEELSSVRLNQGWEADYESNVKIIVKPNLNELKKLVLEIGRNNVMHVFSGWRWFSTLISGLSIIRQEGLNFSIMAEPRVYHGATGVARYFQSLATEGWIRNNVKHVFAIGAKGEKWFKMVGYESKKIKNFAYFVKSPLYNEGIKPAGDDLCIGYLGRLIDMKGVGDVITACSILKDEVSLSLAGYGDMKNIYIDQADRLNVRAIFHDPIPMSSIGNFLRGLDVLILPSRSMDDGWGVVVSEALMCGTPVIVSDLVGSSMAVINNDFGRVVPARHPLNISEAIRDIGKISRDNVFRDNMAKRASAMLSAKAGAKYFLNILNGEYDDGKKYFS